MITKLGPLLLTFSFSYVLSEKIDSNMPDLPDYISTYVKLGKQVKVYVPSEYLTFEGQKKIPEYMGTEINPKSSKYLSPLANKYWLYNHDEYQVINFIFGGRDE